MTTQNLETWQRLGQLLVKNGDITGEQLIRALQSQRSVGGRIGTCLLEMEVLTEDRLLVALSEQLAVPAVRIEQLRGIDEDVLRLVPPRVALRCQAVPFAASKAQISIATLNVRDLTLLDELAFCTNRRVRAHIANEVRIFEALENYYGLECPRRYGHLLDRLNRSRYLWDESAKLLLAGDGGGRRRPADPQPRPAAATALPPELPVPDRPAAVAVRAPAVRESAPFRLSLADVDRLLSRGQDREGVGEVVSRFLGRDFRRSALYQVRRGEVRGWLARGEGLDAEVFGSLRLRLDEPSVFFNLASGAEFYRGPLPPMPIHVEMVRPWGGGLPRECLAVPVRIRQRLVCVLYGDRRAADLADLEVDPYLSLARKAAAALERCILRRKARVA